MFVAAAIHFDMHIPSVIRYLGGNYTAAYRDVPSILNLVKDKVSDNLFLDMKRILEVGAPNFLVAESTQTNFETYRKYGNHPTLSQNIVKVRKVMNKEERNSYVIPFPNWMTRLIPNLHTTPQGLIVKPGKNDRLIFDGSVRLQWNSMPVNDMTHPSNEPQIHFQKAMPNHLRRIWNLRITYPHEDILLWDDDATGAFRQVKLHLDIASTYTFVIEQLLFIPTGQTFGGNTCPPNWEPIARVRMVLAEWLSRDPSLVTKFRKDHLDKVQSVLQGT